MPLDKGNELKWTGFTNFCIIVILQTVTFLPVKNTHLKGLETQIKIGLIKIPAGRTSIVVRGTVDLI